MSIRRSIAPERGVPGARPARRRRAAARRGARSRGAARTQTSGAEPRPSAAVRLPVLVRGGPPPGTQEPPPSESRNLPSTAPHRKGAPRMTRFLVRLADLSYRRRGRMVLGWIAAAVVIIGVGSALAGEFNADYNTPGSESKAAGALTEKRFA